MLLRNCADHIMNLYSLRIILREFQHGPNSLVPTGISWQRHNQVSPSAAAVCRSKFLDCTLRVPRITMRRLQLSCSVQVSSHVSQCACLLSSTSPGHTQQCQEDQVTLMYLCCRVYACTLAIKYVTKVLLKKNWVIPYKVFNIAQPLFNALIWYFEQNSFYQNCEGLEQ